MSPISPEPPQSWTVAAQDIARFHRGHAARRHRKAGPLAGFLAFHGLRKALSARLLDRREQILQGTGKRATHLAEALKLALDYKNSLAES